MLIFTPAELKISFIVISLHRPPISKCEHSRGNIHSRPTPFFLTKFIPYRSRSSKDKPSRGNIQSRPTQILLAKSIPYHSRSSKCEPSRSNIHSRPTQFFLTKFIPHRSPSFNRSFITISNIYMLVRSRNSFVSTCKDFPKSYFPSYFTVILNIHMLVLSRISHVIQYKDFEFCAKTFKILFIFIFPLQFQVVSAYKDFVVFSDHFRRANIRHCYC